MSDLISRQDAIDKIKDWMKLIGYSHGERNVMGCTIQMLEELPSVQKTGKWIVHTEIENVYGGIYIECSECGESYVVQHLEAEIYCRTCGSKNGR